MKLPHLIAVASILQLVGAHSSPAALVILGNLPPINDAASTAVDAGTDNIGNLAHIQSAISFIMPVQNYPVDRVNLDLGGYNTANGDVAVVGFYVDNGNNAPGALFGSLLVSPVSTSDAIAKFTFIPAGPLTLSGSTKYWLMLDASAGEYEWRASAPPITPTSQVGATYGKQILVVNGNPQDVMLPVICNFEILTAVPEPASEVTAMIAFSVFGSGTRKRRAEQA